MKEDVSVERTIAAPAHAVWTALTTPAILKRFYFGSDISTDWTVGSPIRFRGEWKGKTYEDKGTIVAFEPTHLLAYTHWSPMSGTEDRPENYRQVTFELSAVGNGTLVTLTQSRAEGAPPPDAKARAEFASNWERVLAGLKETVEAGG